VVGVWDPYKFKGYESGESGEEGQPFFDDGEDISNPDQIKVAQIGSLECSWKSRTGLAVVTFVFVDFCNKYEFFQHRKHPVHSREQLLKGSW